MPQLMVPSWQPPKPPGLPTPLTTPHTYTTRKKKTKAVHVVYTKVKPAAALSVRVPGSSLTPSQTASRDLSVLKAYTSYKKKRCLLHIRSPASTAQAAHCVQDTACCAGWWPHDMHPHAMQRAKSMAVHKRSQQSQLTFVSHAARVPQMRLQGPLTSPLPGMPPGTAAHCCCCCCCSLCNAEGLPGSAGITVGYTAVILMAGRPSPTRGLRCCCWCDCCCGAAACAALLPCCCLRWPSAAASPRRAGAAAPLGDAKTAAGGASAVFRLRGGGRGVH